MWVYMHFLYSLGLDVCNQQWNILKVGGIQWKFFSMRKYFDIIIFEERFKANTSLRFFEDLPLDYIYTTCVSLMCILVQHCQHFFEET